MTEPDPLTTYLATHDAPCPGCGYNLRGLVSLNCPECSLPLDLDMIQPAEQNQSPGMGAASANIMTGLTVAPLLCAIATAVYGFVVTPSYIKSDRMGFWAASVILLCASYLVLYKGNALLRKKASWACLFNPIVSAMVVAASFGLALYLAYALY